jgi:hypothetical protein
MPCPADLARRAETSGLGYNAQSICEAYGLQSPTDTEHSHWQSRWAHGAAAMSEEPTCRFVALPSAPKIPTGRSSGDRAQLELLLARYGRRSGSAASILQAYRHGKTSRPPLVKNFSHRSPLSPRVDRKRAQTKVQTAHRWGERDR